MSAQVPPRRLSRASALSAREARLAWALAAPALGVISLVALVPIAWTLWESLHLHDLRMPWLGRPFVGLENYLEALRAPRFWSAIGHTAAFVVASVALELAGGVLLALVLDRVARARGLVRTAVLLPWALPTVVAALVWRFMFESPGGLVMTLLDDGSVWAWGQNSWASRSPPHNRPVYPHRADSPHHRPRH